MQILVNALARCQGKMSCGQLNLVAGFSSDEFCPIGVSTLTLYGVVWPIPSGGNAVRGEQKNNRKRRDKGRLFDNQ